MKQYKDLDYKEEVSSYNEAALQIFRLHNLWQDVNYSAKSRNYIGWKDNLERVWMELRADVENLHQDMRIKKIDEVNKLNNCIDKAMLKKDIPLLYKLLLAKETFLRITADEVGKGAARKGSEFLM